MSDKRKLICEGYGEYLEECGGGSSLKDRVVEEKKCYLTLESDNKKKIKLFTNISVSIVSQYVTKVEKDDPLIIRPLGKSDSCIYEIVIEQTEDTLFTTVTGEGLNSYGDSKLSGIKGFQQSLLKSLFRSLRDKRGMICDDYRDLLEECKNVVVQGIPKQVEPKVVETKVPTPNVVEVNSESPHPQWHIISNVCNPNKNVATAEVGGYGSSIIKKIFFDNGQIKYIGYLKNNIFHGFGTEYLEDGKVKYRGEWGNGKYHGKGTLYDEDGFVDHKGEFICGEIE